MRTSIDLNDEILRRAKRRAADEGTSLKALVERALRLLLDTRPSPAKPYRLKWRTESGRIQPGVRLDDRDSLFDLMDRS